MSDLLSEKCGQPSVLRAEDWSEMAERICAWPLPDDLCADAIACKPGAPHRTGTNLITTTQALAMLDYACKPIIDAALTAELEAELMHEREAIDESAKTISRQVDEIKRQLHDNVGLAKELVRERSHSADLSMDLKCAEAERDELRARVARLVGALTDACERMERARNILKTPQANWAMLDTAALRTALEGK